MTKEEYIRRLDDINRRFLELEREKKELRLQYMRESELNKLKCGEKVVVKKGKETVYAFAMGMEISNGEVTLILKKVKKDGTPAQNLRVFYNPEFGHTVERIEQQEEHE